MIKDKADILQGAYWYRATQPYCQLERSESKRQRQRQQN